MKNFPPFCALCKSIGHAKGDRLPLPSLNPCNVAAPGPNPGNLNVIAKDDVVEMINNLDINAHSLNVSHVIIERLIEDNNEMNLTVNANEINGDIVVSSNNDVEHDLINAPIGVIESPFDAILEPIFVMEDFSPLITSSRANEVLIANNYLVNTSNNRDVDSKGCVVGSPLMEVPSAS
ncbi:hypothetical protein MA16_Dca025575 [Dendrobium catenatum]|uniref:Uncharacterized protein n=1 Tax=Dendrobium catenatum TaxID=906689 RepID=A0A2I0W9P1_9ASPA|nr:hypothetical protein MA16_Dca025575 [Dendrobium catenatum]